MAHTLTGCKNTICHCLNFSYSEWMHIPLHSGVPPHSEAQKCPELSCLSISVTTHQKTFTMHFNGLNTWCSIHNEVIATGEACLVLGQCVHQLSFFSTWLIVKVSRISFWHAFKVNTVL